MFPALNTKWLHFLLLLLRIPLRGRRWSGEDRSHLFFIFILHLTLVPWIFFSIFDLTTGFEIGYSCDDACCILFVFQYMDSSSFMHTCINIAFIIGTNMLFQVVCIYISQDSIHYYCNKYSVSGCMHIYIYIYQDSIHYHCNKYIVHVFIQRVFIQPTYLLICQMWLTLMCALFSNTLARNFVYSPADLWVRLIYYTQSGQFITSHTIRLILLHHTQSGWFFFIHHTQSG